MEYILVTLIGGHKLYSMELFWEHVQKLKIQPVKILISCTKDIFDKAIESYTGSVKLTWIHGEDDTGDDQIHSTTSAREALRTQLIKESTIWSMWLDNDILVPVDMVGSFKLLLEKNTGLLFVNAFHPARQLGGDTGKMRHGLGSSFIHKDLLETVPFVHYKLYNRNLGDDYIWKLITSQFMRAFKGSSISGILFNVKHAVEGGSIHEFTKTQLVEMNEVYST